MRDGAETVLGRLPAGAPRFPRLRRLIARPRLRLPALAPRTRRRLLALTALCLGLAAGYQFWFRDSGLVGIDNVRVSGLTTDDAPRIRAALTSAARSMTTLHVDRERLERAVKAFPAVRALELRPGFPHALRIRVLEHHPAAIAVTDGGRVPVAGDGTVLRALPVEGRLPTIKADGTVRGERLEDAAALAGVRVAGGAPAPLRRRLERVERRREEGLVVLLRDGPELIFGTATRVRAKWTAAARVLADKAAAGASYIDLRLPGRPAAGGLPAATVAPVAPAGATTQQPPATGTYAAPGTTTYSAPGTDPPAPAAPTDAAPATDLTTPQPATEAPPATTIPGQGATTAPPTDATGAGAVTAPSP